MCNVLQQIPGQATSVHNGRLRRETADPDFSESLAVVDVE
jgi:hypothetical protein